VALSVAAFSAQLDTMSPQRVRVRGLSSFLPPSSLFPLCERVKESQGHLTALAVPPGLQEFLPSQHVLLHFLYSCAVALVQVCRGQVAGARAARQLLVTGQDMARAIRTHLDSAGKAAQGNGVHPGTPRGQARGRGLQGRGGREGRMGG